MGIVHFYLGLPGFQLLVAAVVEEIVAISEDVTLDKSLTDGAYPVSLKVLWELSDGQWLTNCQPDEPPQQP